MDRNLLTELQQSVGELIASNEDIDELFEEYTRPLGNGKPDSTVQEIAVANLMQILEHRCHHAAGSGGGSAVSVERQMSVTLASVAGRRLKKFVSLTRTPTSSGNALLNSAAWVELDAIVTICCKLRDRFGFSKKTLLKTMHDEESLPAEVIWKLHVNDLITLENFIVRNLCRPSVISALAKDIVKLCSSSQNSTSLSTSETCKKNSVSEKSVASTENRSEQPSTPTSNQNTSAVNARTRINESKLMDKRQEQSMGHLTKRTDRNETVANQDEALTVDTAKVNTGESSTNDKIVNATDENVTGGQGLREQIVCDLVSCLFTIGYGAGTCDARPEDVARGIKKVSTALLDNIARRYFTNADVDSKPDRVDVLLYDVLMDRWVESKVDTEMVKRYCLRQISVALSVKGSLDYNTAISHHSKCSLAKQPRFLRSAYENLLVPLSGSDIIAVLRQTLDKEDISWYPVFTFISVFLVCFPAAKTLMDDLILDILKEAFETYAVHTFVNALLISRQACLEGPTLYRSYQEWFKFLMDFVSGKDAYTTVVHLLSDIVPHEPVEYLRVHIHNSPSPTLKPSYRQRWNDYVDLAKTRLIDLKYAGSKDCINGSYCPAQEESVDGKEAKMADHIQADVEAAVISFEKSSRVPVNILEASIFKRPYFVGKFLPALLQARLVPVSGDSKSQLIDHLHKAGKISESMYSDYKQACQKLESQLLSGVFDEGNEDVEADDTMMMTSEEVLQKTLDTFRDVFIDTIQQQQPGPNHDQSKAIKLLSSISDNICEVIRVDPVTARTSSDENLFIDLASTDIDKNVHKVAHCLLNTFCQAVYSMTQLNLSCCTSDLLSRFLVTVLQYDKVFRAICVIAHQLIQSAETISALHCPGLAAFLAHCERDLKPSKGIFIRDSSQDSKVSYEIASYFIHRLPYSTQKSMQFTLRFALDYVWYMELVFKGKQLNLKDSSSTVTGGKGVENSAERVIEASGPGVDKDVISNKTTNDNKAACTAINAKSASSRKDPRFYCFSGCAASNSHDAFQSSCSMVTFSDVIQLPRCILAAISYLSPRLFPTLRHFQYPRLIFDDSIGGSVKWFFSKWSLSACRGLVSFSDWLDLESRFIIYNQSELLDLQVYYDWVISSCYHPLSYDTVESSATVKQQRKLSAKGTANEASGRSGIVEERATFSHQETVPSAGVSSVDSSNYMEELMDLDRDGQNASDVGKVCVGQKETETCDLTKRNKVAPGSCATSDAATCHRGWRMKVGSGSSSSDVVGYCMALMHAVLDMDTGCARTDGDDTIVCAHEAGGTKKRRVKGWNTRPCLVSMLQKLSSQKLQRSEGGWVWEVLQQRIDCIRYGSVRKVQRDIQWAVETGAFLAVATLLPPHTLLDNSHEPLANESGLKELGLSELTRVINTLAGKYCRADCGFSLPSDLTSASLAALHCVEVGQCDDLVLQLIEACPLLATSCAAQCDSLSMWFYIHHISQPTTAASHTTDQSVAKKKSGGNDDRIKRSKEDKVADVSSKLFEPTGGNVEGSTSYTSHSNQGELHRGPAKLTNVCQKLEKRSAGDKFSELIAAVVQQVRKAVADVRGSVDKSSLGGEMGEHNEVCSQSLKWLYAVTFIVEISRKLTHMPPDLDRVLSEMSTKINCEILAAYEDECNKHRSDNHIAVSKDDDKDCSYGVSEFGIAVVQSLVILYTEHLLHGWPRESLMRLIYNVWNSFPSLIPHSVCSRKPVETTTYGTADVSGDMNLLRVSGEADISHREKIDTVQDSIGDDAVLSSKKTFETATSSSEVPIACNSSASHSSTDDTGVGTTVEKRKDFKWDRVNDIMCKISAPRAIKFSVVACLSLYVHSCKSKEEFLKSRDLLERLLNWYNACVKLYDYDCLDEVTKKAWMWEDSRILMGIVSAPDCSQRNEQSGSSCEFDGSVIGMTLLQKARKLVDKHVWYNSSFEELEALDAETLKETDESMQGHIKLKLASIIFTRSRHQSSLIQR